MRGGVLRNEQFQRKNSLARKWADILHWCGWFLHPPPILPHFLALLVYLLAANPIGVFYAQAAFDRRFRSSLFRRTFPRGSHGVRHFRAGSTGSNLDGLRGGVRRARRF